MEGAAIAQAAYLNGIPYLVIRAISDKADDSAGMDYAVFEEQAIKHSVRLLLEMVSGPEHRRLRFRYDCFFNLIIELWLYLTIDFSHSHLPKPGTGGYNKCHLEQSGEERGAFYAGIFTNRKSIIRVGGNRNYRNRQQINHTEPLQKIIKRN